MVIKKYLVSNMNEALEKIRNELGKNAVIISQRKVRKRGISGFFSSKLLEVTAAVETSKKSKRREVVEMEDSISSLKKLMETEIEEKRNKGAIEEIAVTRVDNNEEVENLKSEISDIKKLLNKTLVDREEKDYLLEIMEELDLCKSFYEEFKEAIENIDNIDNREEVLLKLKEYISKTIKVDNSEIKGRVLLVGPTGVGKTTTIAKLAGKLALKEKKRVGLITIDTYRIGAVEQLKTYAEIMGIDFKVVLNQREMEQAIEEMKDLDVILIDSTGRSSKNIMQIRELKSLLSKAKADTTYLVISGTTKNKDLKEIIEGYKGLDYNKIIFTKLDETTTYGCIYTAHRVSRKPLSYITVGQGVPNDILEAKQEVLAGLILGEEEL